MNRAYAISFIGEIRTEVNNYIEKELNKRGIKGLVVSHGSILTALYKYGGKLPMKDISRRINRSKSTTTQLVNKLIKSGYVKKQISEEDARVHYIILTETGWEIKNDFMEISEEVNGIFFENFTETEQETLLQLLLKVKGNFESI